jgi:hypothetical protein
MTLIYTPDTLRTQVEAASGGKVTVLYDVAGNPNYMTIIPKFNVESIDSGLGTGVHPAFMCWNGTEYVEKPYIMIGQYLGSLIGSNLVSLPGRDPYNNINFDTARGKCNDKGAGWHMMTNAEWAAVALWCWKNGFMPRGNNNFGQDIDHPHETGYRLDGHPIGVNVGASGRTATGSGPISWRHDNTLAGIADLHGNVNEWQCGLRINNGEIQIMQNNRGAFTGADHAAGSALWMAINGADGTLVSPGHANAVKYAVSGTANYTLVRASGSSFEGMTNPGGTPVSAAALEKLKQYGLFPVANTGLGGDAFYLNASGEMLPHRGGNRSSGALAGVFYLHVFYARSLVFTGLGCRPAFVP